MNNMKLEFDKYMLDICDKAIIITPKDKKPMTIEYGHLKDGMGSQSRLIYYPFKIKVDIDIGVDYEKFD